MAPRETENNAYAKFWSEIKEYACASLICCVNSQILISQKTECYLMVPFFRCFQHLLPSLYKPEKSSSEAMLIRLPIALL